MQGNWHPLKIHPGQPEYELTQRNDFLDDDEALLSTVAREFIQNALDAARDPRGTVRVSLRTTDVPKAALEKLLAGLDRHAAACGLAWDPAAQPSALVMEDFGTTGLVGAYDRKEDEGTPWTDFWWRFGRSGKTGEKQGRNGLGRISYAVLSEIGAFWVLTRREGEDTSLLMGLALLNTRSVGGERYQPLMYWGLREQEGQLVLPVTDETTIRRFEERFGRSRKEPGVTVVVPLPRMDPESWADQLRPAIIRNQYFAILRGRLQIDVDGAPLTAQELPRMLPPEERPFLDFAKEAVDLLATGARPTITLPGRWREATEDLGLPEDRRKDLAERLRRGETIHARMPFTIRVRKEGTRIHRGRMRRGDYDDREGHLDVFLRSASEEGHDLFVRDDLAIIKEHYLQGRRVFALSVTERNPLATLLGDAEDPAHMRWRLNTERLRLRYSRPADVIKDVRHAARRLHDAIAGKREERILDALESFFSVPRATASEKPEEGTEPPDIREEKTPDPLTIRRLKKGDRRGIRVVFRRLEGDSNPWTLRIRLRYETINGGSRAREVDFHRVLCSASATAGGELRDLIVDRPRFNEFAIGLSEEVEEAVTTITGVDPDRTLRVEAFLE